MFGWVKCPFQEDRHLGATQTCVVLFIYGIYFVMYCLHVPLADTGDTRGLYSATKAVYGPSYQGLNPLHFRDGQSLLKEKVARDGENTFRSY